MPPLPDQTDILAENATMKATAATHQASLDKVTSDLATATASLATITGERDQHAADLGSAKASLTSVTNQLTEATGKVTKLEAEKVEHDKAVAVEVARLGISSKAVPAAAKASEKQTATLEQFKALSSTDQNQFIRDGGKII